MITKMKSLKTPQAQLKRIGKIKLFRRKSDLLGGSFNQKGTESLLISSDTTKNSFKDGPFLFRRKNDFEKCKNLSDSELINVIHEQNREAYWELFARYQKKLFTYVFHLVGNRDETEDILQNVFSKTFKNIDHFDTSRKFSSWIYRIAHNEAVNFLKRKSKRFTVSWEDITTSKDKLETASSEELPDEKWSHAEIKKEIDDALVQLPKKYQQVLRLRYFKEYSYEDIGAILKKPVNTVGTLINRAKRKLLDVVRSQKNIE